MVERLLFIFILKLVIAQDVKLPLCPTNIDYLPQTLPMHCRMPRNANYAMASEGSEKPQTLPPFMPPYYQSPPPNKFPFPLPPGFPGFPGMPVHGSPAVPGAIPMPMPGPMPVPMAPIPITGPGHKLPVIVMPIYSPDKSYQSGKERNPSQNTVYSSDGTDSDSSSSTDTDTSSDSDTSGSNSDRGRHSKGSNSDRGFWKSKRGFRRSGKSHHKHRPRRKKWPREIVTPVLQYVNKNGYVVFEKKITRGEAKEWLNEDMPNKKQKTDYDEDEDNDATENVLKGEIKEKSRDEDKSRVSIINIEPAKPEIIKRLRKRVKHVKQSPAEFKMITSNPEDH